MTCYGPPQALNPEEEEDFDEEAELSIVLCTDAYIHDLNKQWRDKDAPTDVLSFPQVAARLRHEHHSSRPGVGLV